MKTSPSGFTLIELLTVMVVIAVLASLVLGTAGYIQKKGAAAKAESEIAAMSAAIENYKGDNGTYPRDNSTRPDAKAYDRALATEKLNARVNGDPVAATSPYKPANQFLYRHLSGDRNCDAKIDATDKDDANNVQFPTYMEFKPTMLSGPKLAGGQLKSVAFIIDPFGLAYGYSLAYAAEVDAKVAVPTKGYNPTFDLWSTAGTKKVTDEAKWIKNW